MKIKSVNSNANENSDNLVSDAGNEIIKSGKDWIHYIEGHPLQSVFFGLIGYFALKGLFKK